MTDNNSIYNAITKIAFAYILILIKIMIVTIDILPDFIGYLMILNAAASLKNECKSISLLKSFCVILAIWNFITFIFDLFGINSVTVPVDAVSVIIVYIISFITMIISIISIYFNYQMSTEMSLLAAKYHNDKLSKTFITRRNIITVCQTVIFLINNITPVFNGIPDDIRYYLMIIPGLIALAVMFLIVSALFSLRKEFKDNQQNLNNIADANSDLSYNNNDINSDISAG